MKKFKNITVREWVNKNKTQLPHKTIRMINYSNHQGLGLHWLECADDEIKKIKITNRWIFIFI